MEGGKGTNTLMLVCVSLSVIAVVLSGYAVLADDSDDTYDSVRYTLYFGMGDRTDEEVQSVEDFIISEFDRVGFGYNLERESGGYVSDGKPMKDRVSLKFVVTDRDEKTIRDIIDNTKERFGIEAVFLEKDMVSSEFC